MKETEKSYNYFAFISYSHIDKKWGDWLHKSLETYRVPRHLVGRESRDGTIIQKRISPIFRDREELPTSSNLGEMINNALLDSLYLIVICSPHSAKSRWVNEEILSFKKSGRADRILCIIVDGEPNASDKAGGDDKECFAEALKYEIGENNQLTEIRSEPIAADARPGKDGKLDAKLKLVAGILGVGFDEIKQRELQRRNKKLFITAIASLLISSLTIVLAITAYLSKNEAVMQRQIAEVARDHAQKNLAAALFEKAQKAYSQKKYNEAALLAAEAWVKDPKNYYPGIFKNEDLLTPLSGILEGKVKSGVNDIEVYENILFSSHDDKSIRKWDLINLSFLDEFKNHQDLIRDIELTSDGKKLVSASYDRTVKVIDTTTGEEFISFNKHTEQVYTIAIHPDESIVASGDNFGNVLIWKIDTGEILASLITKEAVPVMQLEFEKSGKYLISSGGDNGELNIWNTDNWKKQILVPEIKYGIWGFYLFKNNKKLAFVAGDNQEEITVIDLENDGNILLKTVFPGEWFRDVLVNEKQSLLISSTRYGHLNMLNIENKVWLRSVFAHDLASRRVILGENDNQLISSSIDGSIRVWDLNKHFTNSTTSFEGGNSRIYSISINPEKSLIAAGNADGIVYVWDIKTGKLIKKWIDNDQNIITHVEFFPDNKTLLVSGANKLRLISMLNDKVNEYAYQNSSEEPHLKIFSDGKKIIRSSSQGKSEIFDLMKNEILKILDNKRTFVHAIALNELQNLLAIGGFEGAVDIWDTETGTVNHSFNAHDYSIRAVVFDSDGNLLSAGTDSIIKFWEKGSYDLVKTYTGHNSRVRTLALSPDNSFFASGDEEGKVKVWNKQTGELVLTIHGPASYVSQVSYGRNNDELFIAYFDGTLRKLDLRKTRENPEKHLTRIRKLTGLKVDGIKTVTLKRKEWEKIIQ